MNLDYTKPIICSVCGKDARDAKDGFLTAPGGKVYCAGSCYGQRVDEWMKERKGPSQLGRG